MDETWRRAWTALTAAPGTVGQHVVSRAIGVKFSVLGLVGLVLGLCTDRLWWLLPIDEAIALTCVVLGLVLLTQGSRLPAGFLVVPLLLSVATITIVVRLAPSGTVALSLAMLYVVVVLEAFSLLSWLVATAHLALVGVGLVWALQHRGSVDALSVGVVICVLLTTAGLTGCLARAAATAEIDHLTGLHNRRGLQRRADEVMAQGAGGAAVVVIIDLDHFKALNDSIGHEGGDDLLRMFGHALRAALPAPALAGRWGGDEFVVLLPDVGAATARAVVEQVRAGLPPGRSLSAGLAEGVRADGLALLLNRADAALYRAKRHARGTTRAHGDEGLGEGWVRTAASAGQLEVFFQPIVDLEDDDVIGAEALVRWRHPERGLLAPDAFLGEAVADGSIVDIDAWVLAVACQESAAWARRADGSRRSVGVNVSGQDLERSDYAEQVLAVLAESGLPATSLVLEITEGALDVDSPVVCGTLERLRAAGIHLAMDDFGTGYSTLGRLAEVPMDVLKVDRLFTSLVTDADDAVPLLTAVLAMAGALGLDTVAEGVETGAQAEWLRRSGCRRAQGYLFGAPVPRADFSARLGRGSVRVAALPAVTAEVVRLTS